MTALPLVLACGQLLDQRVWAPQVAALSAARTVSVSDHQSDDTIAGMARRLLDAAPARFALAGLAMGGWLAATAPWALWFAAPVALPLALAIPVAVLTTWPPLGAVTRRHGILAIPEELEPIPAPSSRRALTAV